MNIEDMYKLTRNEHAAWGVEGYEVAKVYADPLK
jgi:hypothetical protein